MSESNIQHVGIKDFLSIAVGLIATDLKIQKHLDSLSLGGVDSLPIQLELHKYIFKLMQLDKSNNVVEIKEWYFQQIQQAFSIDVINDIKALAEVSAEILKGLNRFRMESINVYKITP